MSKIVCILAGFAAILASCTNKEGGNKSVIEQEVTKTVVEKDGKIDTTMTTTKVMKDGDKEIREKSVRYIATDGSGALVTFISGTEGNFLTVKSNQKVIKVREKSKDIYEENGIEALVKGDSLIITQGNNVIELRKAKGE